MSRKNFTRAERREFWKLIIQEQAVSKLSISAFCKKQGIYDSQFYLWRNKLESEKTAQLIPVKVIPEAGEIQKPESTSNVIPTVEVVTPSGFTVRLSENIDKKQLQDVLAVIGGTDHSAKPC